MKIDLAHTISSMIEACETKIHDPDMLNDRVRAVLLSAAEDASATTEDVLFIKSMVQPIDSMISRGLKGSEKIASLFFKKSQEGIGTERERHIENLESLGIEALDAEKLVNNFSANGGEDQALSLEDLEELAYFLGEGSNILGGAAPSIVSRISYLSPLNKVKLCNLLLEELPNDSIARKGPDILTALTSISESDLEKISPYALFLLFSAEISSSDGAEVLKALAQIVEEKDRDFVVEEMLQYGNGVKGELLFQIIDEAKTHPLATKIKRLLLPYENLFEHAAERGKVKLKKPAHYNKFEVIKEMATSISGDLGESVTFPSRVKYAKTAPLTVTYLSNTQVVIHLKEKDEGNQPILGSGSEGNTYNSILLDLESEKAEIYADRTIQRREGREIKKDKLPLITMLIADTSHPGHAFIESPPIFTHKYLSKKRKGKQPSSVGKVEKIHELRTKAIGDLLLIINEKDALGLTPSGALKSMTIQMLQGLSLLHKHGIVHRDLKPDNILVMPDWTIRISDLDDILEIENSLKGREWFSGTKGKTPDRVFQGLEAHTYASDLYTMGVVVQELFFGRLYDTKNHLEDWQIKNNNEVRALYKKAIKDPADPSHQAAILMRRLQEPYVYPEFAPKSYPEYEEELIQEFRAGTLQA